VAARGQAQWMIRESVPSAKTCRLPLKSQEMIPPPPSFDGGRERTGRCVNVAGARRRRLDLYSGPPGRLASFGQKRRASRVGIRRRSNPQRCFVATLLPADFVWDRLSRTAGGSPSVAGDDIFLVILLNIFDVVLYYLGYRLFLTSRAMDLAGAVAFAWWPLRQ
jgi:hypothetical protein